MLVYQREPHARQMAFEAIPQPTNYGERVELAQRTRDDFGLRWELVVDAMDDRSRAMFGDQPNSLVVIGADGVVCLKQPWANPDELERDLPRLLVENHRRMLSDAAIATAAPRVKVAAALLRNDLEVGNPVLKQLAGDDDAGEFALLLQLASATATPNDEALRQLWLRSRRIYTDRPDAYRAFLARLVDITRSSLREQLLDELVAVSPDADSRVTVWVAAQRSEVERSR